MHSELLEAWVYPACAGEPLACGVDGGRCEVYPRVCGGTSLIASLAFGQFGLSPRVRGNQGAKEDKAGEWRLSPRVRGNRCHEEYP